MRLFQDQINNLHRPIDVQPSRSCSRDSQLATSFHRQTATATNPRPARQFTSANGWPASKAARRLQPIGGRVSRSDPKSGLGLHNTGGVLSAHNTEDVEQLCARGLLGMPRLPQVQDRRRRRLLGREVVDVPDAQRTCSVHHRY